MSEQHSVGHGKPPIKNQFKKGKSGNPSGRRKRPRPKPPLDPQKILIAELKSLITITENGKKKKITALKAISKKLVADTLKGDKIARKYLLDFMLKQDKYAFEDDGVLLFRITKKQQEAMEEFRKLAAPYYDELGLGTKNSSPASS